MYKNILAILGILLVGASIVMAISGATTTWVSDTRWSGNTSGSDITQGGNITALNIAASVLTSKWASYYGNVTGSIVLGDGNANVYSWTLSEGSVGEVCVSTNTSFNFTSAATATGANINTAWGFTATDADSGNNTYRSSNCNISFAQANITNTGNVSLQGSSNFNNCVIRSGTVAAGTTGFLAFCTNLQPRSSGLNYAGQPANYEIMVATNNAPGATETYYFYAELS
ncbi:MAG: hypothetical protein PHV13_03925 [Candidatus ainarchaeum sp.]|nr:hypothetical protein [Candidatus ainarchaeum sp.]